MIFAINPIDKRYIGLYALLLLLVSGCSRAGNENTKLDQIELPPGFAINVFASGLSSPRQMALGKQGTVFVGSRSDSVYALQDTDSDGRADKKYTIASGLQKPNGVAFRDGDLYVAEIPRLSRYADIEANLQNPPEAQVLSEDFPNRSHHGYRFIKFGPDGRLYLPIGAPCNVCEAPGFGLILSMQPDASDKRIYAKGIRNSVGFDWQPDTGVLWFTDNGRDNLGDNRPPGELNRAPQAGMHFGFPYCHGGDIADPKFGDERKCGEFAAPAQKLGPHVAPLGMRFYDGKMFPKQYQGDIFIAEHGSWNRSKKIGYRITRVSIDGDNATQYEPFASGWLQGQSAWGRPADVLVAPDGALLVSDDQSGVIYRISYKQ
mgnify:CR=1 FL=1